MFTKLTSKACLLVAVFALMLSGADVVSAKTKQKTVDSTQMIPGIWVDPDGCEHWVMDDGWEGFMTPNVTRDGKPVCRSGKTCAVLATDQLFATNQYSVSAKARKRIIDIFEKTDAKAFIITGHTDSRASDAYNMKLSEKRANAVAKIARDRGVKVLDARGYGERLPKASNATAAGMRKNRRVEIVCVH